MGGVSGRLNHLYNNLDLPFAKLKRILYHAAEGKLIGTEKTDGFAITLSYRNGEAVAARNIGDIKTGGLNHTALADRKFAGGDTIKKIYLRAFSAFERAVASMPEKEREEIFQNGQVFVSAEIQGPGAENTLNYDKNVLTIHPRMHKRYDPETGGIETFTDTALQKRLDRLVDEVEQEEVDGDFQLQKAAWIKLNDLSDKHDLNIVINKINKEMKRYGMEDENTLGHLLQAKIIPQIQSSLPGMNDDVYSIIYKNMLGQAKMKELPEDLPKEVKKRITAIRKNGPIFLTKAIYPIEEAIHDFTVELLKGLESVYVLDNKKELDRLRDDVAQAIDIIQGSNNKDAMDILAKQLQKLKNTDNINTAIEGFVFDYEGQSYKFTGNFAPINQILGLFRFGRGKKIPPFAKHVDPPAEEQEEETPKHLKEIEQDFVKIYALFPGGFKPPHIGHFNAVQQIVRQYNADRAYVIISPKERAAHSAEKRIVIDKEEALEIWRIYTREDPVVIPKISQFASPVQAVYNFIDHAPEGCRIVLGMGQKDIEGGDTRYKRAQKYAADRGIEVEFAATPSLISGTAMREFVLNGNEGQFKKYLPTHLSPGEKEKVWQICSNPEKENIFEANFQDLVKRTHPAEKRRLIGTGGQSNTEPYIQKPSMKRSKSAPPIGEQKSDITKEQRMFVQLVEDYVKGAHWMDSDSSIFKDAKKQFPRTWKACQKFGAKSVKKYIESMNTWEGGTSQGKVVKFLLANKAIGEMINPMKKVKYLFRGLTPGNTPEPGQSVVYTTKRPYTSWSKDIGIANDFGEGGVILAIPFSYADGKYADIFFWPHAGEMKKFEWHYEYEKEYALAIKKPMPIPAIRFTELDPYDNNSPENDFYRHYYKILDQFRNNPKYKKLPDWQLKSRARKEAEKIVKTAMSKTVSFADKVKHYKKPLKTLDTLGEVHVFGDKK